MALLGCNKTSNQSLIAISYVYKLLKFMVIKIFLSTGTSVVIAHLLLLVLAILFGVEVLVRVKQPSSTTAVL